MPLYWVDDEKCVSQLPKTRVQFYNATDMKLRQIGSSAQELYNYVESVIDDEIDSMDDNKVFIRPGWLFSHDSKHWDNTPLSKLYEKPPAGIGYYNDSEQKSGLFLGLLVYQYMINSQIKWLCTKTSFNNRDFETAVYWTSEL